MRLEKKFVLISIIMLLFLLCSCAKGGNGLKIETSPPDSDLKIETSPSDSGLKIETSPPDGDLKIAISPPDKSLIDLASEIYDEPQLLKIVRFNGLMDELNAQYPIECLRREGNGYRAAYLGDGCVAVLRFDNYRINVGGQKSITHSG